MSTEKYNPSQILKEATTVGDRAAVSKIYNDWSKTYDADMPGVQYYGPQALVEHFSKLGVPKTAKILDICAGTGAIGRELVKCGYSDLHAFDGAEKMLEKAKEEGHYKSYTHLLLQPGGKLPYADGEFDAVLMSGIFAPGHLPIASLHEICRITKVGGVVAWINADPVFYEKKDPQFYDGGFYKLLDEITGKGIWKKRDGFPVTIRPYIEYSDGLIMVYDIVGK